MPQTAARIMRLKPFLHWNDNIAFPLNPHTMTFYPVYYRKGSVCIKREDPQNGKQVDLSELSNKNPFRIIRMADKAAFDLLVADMEMVSNEIYERYLIHLHNRSKFEAKTFREVHDRSPEFPGPDQRRKYLD
jgi:hypothetical protein